MAWFWYDPQKGKYMPEDSAEAQRQPLAAQANIGGDGHSASVGDSYYSPGPRNGFIEIQDMTMELADFKKRLEKVEGVKAAKKEKEAANVSIRILIIFTLTYLIEYIFG